MIDLSWMEEEKAYPVAFRTKWVWWKPKTYISLFIRLRYGSVTNHSATMYKYRGHIHVHESDWKGNYRTLWENYKRKSDRVFLLDYKERLYTFDRMVTQEGTGYDYKGLIRHLGRWTSWKPRKEDGRKRYCFESTAYNFGVPNSYKIRPIDMEKNMKELL